MKAAFAWFALLTVLGPCAAADLLIFGGPIYSRDATQVEALLVRGDRVVFAGALEQARRQAVDARPIDLEGAVAYPGFVDAHAHLTGIGLRELTLNLDQVNSIESLVATLVDQAKAHPGSDPIMGRGWIETHWPEQRFPTRADIDRAISDRPVFLVRADGHAAIANSRALALGGVDAKTLDPAGGKILRDASGEPTGMLIDAAMGLVRARLPAISFDRRREALERAVALYAARGWTAVHNMSATREDVAILEELAQAHKLPIRVDNYMELEDAGQVLAKGPSQDPTGLVHVRGVKIYIDGALGSRGAALLSNYSDAPGNGLLRIQPDEFARQLQRARASGAQVATHAIGDRGNRLALDAYASTFGKDVEALRRARWRIEHAQILDPADIPRFGKLGVIASMQPSHAIGDLYFAPSRLGLDRLVGAYAWRRLLDTGALIVAGSDAPVEKGDPLIEFYAATWRHDLQGHAGPEWHLEQAVTRPEALRMLTAAPAYAVFRERELGTLEPGKLADLTVFSADLMSATPEQILSVQPVMTIVGGTVFERPVHAEAENTLQDELRIFAEETAAQCKSVKEQLEDFKVKSDPLTGYNLRDAVQSLCVCMPEKSQAWRSTLSSEELARPVTEQEFLQRFNPPVIDKCAAEQMRSMYGDQCRKRFQRSGLDERQYCSCMQKVVNGYSEATSAEIAAAASDYLPTAAAAEKNGEPVPPRPPILEAYYQADQACKVKR